MKSYRFAYATVIAAILIPGVTQAMDLAFRPRLEGGIQFNKIEVDNIFRVGKDGRSGNAASDLKMEDWLPVVSGGVTVVANRFFVDLSGLKSFNGEDDFSRNAVIVDDFVPITAKTKGDSDFDRWEYSISLGYMVTDNLSFFAGYKKTEVDLKFKANNITGNIPPDINFRGSASVKSEFEEDGPFVGAGYGWHINKSIFKGVLSGNLAFAALDGKLKVKNASTNSESNDLNDEQLEDLNNLTREFLEADKSKGDMIGMKIGFTWIGSTSIDQLTYTIGVDGYRYDFDAENDQPDVTDTVINFKAGLAYTF